MRAQSQQCKHPQEHQTSTNQYELISNDQEQFECQNLEANYRDEFIYFDSEESTSERDNAYPIKKELFYLDDNKEYNEILLEEEVQNLFCQDVFFQNQLPSQNNQKDDQYEQNEQRSDVCIHSEKRKINKKISKKKMINKIPQYNIESQLLPKATKNIYKNIVRALTSFSSIKFKNYSQIETIHSWQKCAVLQEFHRKDGETGKEKLNWLLQSQLGRNLCKVFFKKNKFAIEFLKNNKTDLSTTFRMIPDFSSLCD